MLRPKSKREGESGSETSSYTYIKGPVLITHSISAWTVLSSSNVKRALPQCHSQWDFYIPDHSFVKPSQPGEEGKTYSCLTPKFLKHVLTSNDFKWSLIFGVLGVLTCFLRARVLICVLSCFLRARVLICVLACFLRACVLICVLFTCSRAHLVAHLVEFQKSQSTQNCILIIIYLSIYLSVYLSIYILVPRASVTTIPALLSEMIISPSK